MARLLLFFGATSGVGKTHAMREAARAMPGVVDASDAVDVKALLASRPAGVAIDDLARANPPGSRHAARWQDANELLRGGIDVLATLDVRNLASLADVIEEITGAPPERTVPDMMIDRADDLVLVDLPTDAMMARVTAAGRPVERGVLLALRELALRRTAEWIDAQVLRDRRAPSRERILVCVGASPSSERLIRAGRRMAERLDAAWLVANVERIAAPLGDRDGERLESHMRLAESLGAEVVRLRGSDVAGPLLGFARDQGITRIVAG